MRRRCFVLCPQTLDYVRTPHRFELTLSRPLTIGMRRAAQRMIGAAAQTLKAAGGGQTPPDVEVSDVRAALDAALLSMPPAK